MYVLIDSKNSSTIFSPLLTSSIVGKGIGIALFCFTFAFLIGIAGDGIIELWDDTKYSIMNHTDWMGFYIILAFATTILISVLIIIGIASIFSIKDVIKIEK